MSIKALYDLREMLCDELEAIAKKPEMSAGDLETVHKLTDTVKNIDKISLLEEDGGYSQAGDWEMEGRGTYGRGNSYANRGKHYVRGHYSRDDGRMDGYKNRIADQMRSMMDNAGSEREREAIRRCISQLENA